MSRLPAYLRTRRQDLLIGFGIIGVLILGIVMFPGALDWLDNDGFTNSTDGIAIVLFAVGLYLLPSIVAFERKMPSKWSVAVINLLLGWTLIGYVIALAIAVRSKPEPEMSEATLPIVDTGERLGKLAELHREGLLTAEEFAAAKARALEH